MAADPRFMHHPPPSQQQQQQQQTSLQQFQQQHGGQPHQQQQPSDPAMMAAAAAANHHQQQHQQHMQHAGFQQHPMQQPMYRLSDAHMPPGMSRPNTFYSNGAQAPQQQQPQHPQMPANMLQPTRHFNSGFQSLPGPSSHPMKMEFSGANMSFDAADMSEDYENDPNGGPSDKNQDFSCDHCDKVYKGKHARSIWRRHLQDKHGIPLSIQPRRTRWDADVNRPKNAEERRERMLESKRRWARKKRAQDKIDATSTKREGDDAEDDEDGTSIASGPASCNGSAKPPSAREREEGVRAMQQQQQQQQQQQNQQSLQHPHPQSQPQPQHLQPQHDFAGPHGPPDGIHHPHAMMPPQPAAFDGHHGMVPSEFANGGFRMMAPSMSHPGMPMRPNSTDGVTWTRQSVGPSALSGHFPGGNQHNEQPQRVGSGSPKQAQSQPPSMPVASTPSRVVSQAMGRSASSGSVVGSSNPFSLEHHKISPAQTRSGHRRLDSASNFLNFGESPSRALSQGASSSSSSFSDARNILPSLYGTPSRSLSRDDSMFLLKSGGGLGDSSRKSSSARRAAWPSMGDGLRSSSDDERETLGRKRGLEESDDFDDSGISLPTMTPFSKSFGRAPFSSLTNLVGATPMALAAGDVLDAFPSTVRKPTKRDRSDSVLSASDSRRRRQKGGHGGSSDDDVMGAPDSVKELAPRRHRRDSTSGNHFSSPQPPNLARSLGLAPQSAVRGTRHGRTGSHLANVLATPGSHGSMLGGLGGSPFQHASLGFTPFDRMTPGGMMGLSGGLGTPNGLSGSPGKLTFSWPESVKRPTTIKKTNKGIGGGGSAQLIDGRRGSSSLTSNAITAKQLNALNKEVNDDGDDGDDDDASPAPPIGMSPSSDSDDGQYHASLAETPSRPSGSQAAYRRAGSVATSSFNGSAQKGKIGTGPSGPHIRSPASGKGGRVYGDEDDEDDEDEGEDDEEVVPMPLRALRFDGPLGASNSNSSSNGGSNGGCGGGKPVDV